MRLKVQDLAKSSGRNASGDHSIKPHAPETVGDNLYHTSRVQHRPGIGRGDSKPQSHLGSQEGPAVPARGRNQAGDLHWRWRHRKQIGVQLAEVEHLQGEGTVQDDTLG